MPWLIAVFLVMLFLTPFDRIYVPVHLPVDAALDRFVLGFLFLAWVVTALASRKGPRFKHAPINGAIFAFVALCVVSLAANLRELAWDGELGLSVKQLSLVVSYLAFFFIASSAVRRTEVVVFAKLTVALAVLTALGTVVQYRSGTNLFGEFSHAILPGLKVEVARHVTVYGARSGSPGPTPHPLADATLLSAALPLALAMAGRARTPREEWVMLGASLVLLGGCVATGRKTAFLVPVVSIIVLVLYDPRRYLRYWPGVIVAVAATRLLAPHALSGLLYRLSHGTNSQSTVTRESDYAAVTPFVGSHLLFGRGYGSFDPVKYRILDDQMLGFLVQTGALGVVSYAGIMLGAGMTVHRAARRARTLADGLMAAVVAVAAGYFASNFLYDAFGFRQGPYVFFWIAALGAAYAGWTSEEELVEVGQTAVPTGSAKARTA